MRYLSISHCENVYNKTKTYEVILVRIRDLREDNEMTQKQVAEYLHVKQNTYSQYENELRQIPIDSLIALARLYKTSVDYILGLTDETKPYR